MIENPVEVAQSAYVCSLVSAKVAADRNSFASETYSTAAAIVFAADSLYASLVEQDKNDPETESDRIGIKEMCGAVAALAQLLSQVTGAAADATEEVASEAEAYSHTLATLVADAKKRQLS